MKQLLSSAHSAIFKRMEERINILESLVAQQDQTIQSLSEEIFRQQQDMAKLARRLEVLEEQLRELLQGNEIAGNERPPHW